MEGPRLVVMALVLAVLVITACARQEAGPSSSIEPVPMPSRQLEAHSTGKDGAPRHMTPGSDEVNPRRTRPDGDAMDDDAIDDEELRALVDAVLLRYDEVLTRLAEDPARHSAEGSEVRRDWDQIVQGGSWLSFDVPAGLLQRQHEQGMVVRPAPGGLAYRHRPLLVEGPEGDSISFTWCGWSPGIGVDHRTGEVLDDGVAHAHGTGQIRRTPLGWQLEALDELDLDVLPPGSPDPCPAEVAARTGDATDGTGGRDG